ncbi:MAG: hypothetical protein FWE46_04910 [Coriobacteriia bacterium]|nr:hypothetical protein [Coriobacteriia bacterium]MCL2537430.1 hypothetical protein [Coriobacteriia bacterium]
MFRFGKRSKNKKSNLFLSVPETRAIEYIVREMTENGRDLFDVMEDPFVRNRIVEERRYAIKQDEELLEAFEAEIHAVRLRLEAEDLKGAEK